MNTQPRSTAASAMIASLIAGAASSTGPKPALTTLEKAGRVINCARDHITDWTENEGKADPDCHEAKEALAEVAPLLLSAPAMMRLLTQVITEARDGQLQATSQSVEAIHRLLSDPVLKPIAAEIALQGMGASGNETVVPAFAFAPSIRPGVLYRDWIAKKDRRISANPSEENLVRYDKFAQAIVEGKSILTSKEDFERFGRLREYGNRHGLDLASVYVAFDNDQNIASDGDVRTDLISAEDVQKFGSVLATDILGDYNDPENVPEMCWIEKNGSFLHTENGREGIWEFFLNLARPFDDVPAKLQPLLDEAKRKNLAYLLIHQGT